MSPDDRLRIEWQCARLVALYANLNDEARWEEVAALYADEGWMNRPSAPEVRIAGRAAILEALKSRPPRITRHVCSNVVIDVESPKTASGVCAMVLFSPDQPPLAGSFHDRFVLTEAGWRFAGRDGSLIKPYAAPAASRS